jgi:trehalose 6-phosphate phosphatase
MDLLPPPDLDGPNWALFLDIDGTLVEHAPHPDAVVVDADLRILLAALQERFDGALALVTGRSVVAADRLFAPLELRAAGLYGLEHRLESGGPVEPAKEPADIAALADEIEVEFAGRNVHVERKGPILAIHTRAAPDLLDRAIQLVEQALTRLPPNYRLLPGNAGVELMPLEAVKGAAIRRFIKMEDFRGRRPVFLGDDTSDETGFEVINEAGGISIRVKPNGATLAGYALADVAATLEWLRRQRR